MPKNPGNKGLQDVGGWCGIFGGGAMVLIFAYLGTALFQSNAGIDWGRRLEFIPDHRMEYRFCWAAVIVISVGLLPFLLALYQGIKERAGTLAVLGGVSGALGLIFMSVSGAIRASAIPGMALKLQEIKGPASLKTSLIFSVLFSEKFAFHIDNYVATGLLALAGLFVGAALNSMPRYPKGIVYGFYLVAILGIVGILEDLLFHSLSFHIRGYDYNVFVSAFSALLPIVVIAQGVRLVSGKNP